MLHRLTRVTHRCLTTHQRLTRHLNTRLTQPLTTHHPYSALIWPLNTPHVSSARLGFSSASAPPGDGRDGAGKGADKGNGGDDGAGKKGSGDWHPFLSSRDQEMVVSSGSEAAAALEDPLRAMVIDRAGAVEMKNLDRHDVIKQFNLQGRDLRSLDASFRNLPVILVRDHAILVNLELVRALISHDQLIVFAPWHPRVASKMVPKLREVLSSSSSAASGVLPYEFIALERILKTTCVNLDRRLATFTMSIEPLLKEAQETRDPRAFSRMLPLKYGLSSFEMSIKEVADALQELLDSDEDMAMAYLSVMHRTGHRRRPDQHQELELLLETYLKQVEEMGNEVTKLRTNIAATEQLISIELDRARNQIMRADLMLQIGTFGVSTGALVAGIFGMNLLSGLETHPLGFWVTASGIALGSGFIIRSALRMAKVRKLT